VALHHGSALREEVRAQLAIGPHQRRREEDPHSGDWARISPNHAIALRSRFEVDLNRPPQSAVYREPDDAWGVRVWNSRPPPALIERSLAEHALFYRTMHTALDILLERSERVLVLDLHCYNHRRSGPNAPPDDPRRNPDLNVGTGTMDRARWAPVVDAFIDAARNERAIDVRENVRFRGAYFPSWVHRTFPDRACALALEVKKTFMDEWTGEIDLAAHAAWRDVIRAGTIAALEALR
jgi:N-formylglutamate amidohydrolase